MRYSEEVAERDRKLAEARGILDRADADCPVTMPPGLTRSPRKWRATTPTSGAWSSPTGWHTWVRAVTDITAPRAALSACTMSTAASRPAVRIGVNPRRNLGRSAGAHQGAVDGAVVGG